MTPCPREQHKLFTARSPTFSRRTGNMPDPREKPAHEILGAQSVCAIVNLAGSAFDSVVVDNMHFTVHTIERGRCRRYNNIVDVYGVAEPKLVDTMKTAFEEHGYRICK